MLDTSGDWEQYRQNGVLGYLLEMKKAGVVRHIGLSTHTPELDNIRLTLLVEQLMFSINPRLRLPAGRICQRQRRRADGPIPPLRSGRDGYFGHEALFRRPACWMPVPPPLGTL